MYLEEKSSTNNEDALKNKSGAELSDDGLAIEDIEFEDKELDAVQVTLNPKREMYGLDNLDHKHQKPYLIPASFKIKIDSFSNIKIHSTKELLSDKHNSYAPKEVEFDCVLFDATN